jgi:hypothetical protein
VKLPDYFIADLPPEATLSPTLIREACQTIRRNRKTYLADRSTPRLVRVLSALGHDWLQPDSPFRRLALERGPDATGFPAPTLARGLDSFFRQLTEENLRALLIQELGHVQRLDGMTATATEVEGGRAAMANGPELLVHVAAGNIPNPTLTSLTLGLLTHSAQFLKCAQGTSLLPRLFAHSLYEVEPKLAACLEIAEWPGGSAELETPLFEEADCVTATGSDATVAALRQRVPATARFLGYGHRVSFAYIARDALFASNLPKLLAQAASDVAAWNQLGCLSPHVFYVETGGALTPEQFAAQLAGELARREAEDPRGRVPMETAAAIASRRAFYEIRAAHSPETRLWHCPHSTAWTVVYETDPLFAVSCLHRFVYVKAARDLTQALQGADAVQRSVSTVGLAATEDRARELATQLARWGATRVCPLGQMQNPPLAWRHDGRPNLGDLVTWMDWEQSI